MKTGEKKLILISDYKQMGFAAPQITWESDRNKTLSIGRYCERYYELVPLISAVKKMIVEVSDFTHEELHFINDVGLDGLKRTVTLNLAEEFMAEVRARETHFSIELFQIINAINCNEYVTLRAGIDIREIVNARMARRKAYEKEQRNKEPWDFLTGEVLSSMIKF